MILKNFLRWIIGVHFGQENKLKSVGQCIYVANHNSHLDTACFLAIIPTNLFLKTHPVAAGDYFGKNKILKNTVKFLFNVLLIERKSLKNLNTSMKEISHILDKGHSLLFFPEGSRGRPEVISEFKVGIAHILKKHSHIPYLPLYMKGLGLAMPKGDPILIPHESKILIGNPTLIPNITNYSNHEIANMIKESILNLNEA